MSDPTREEIINAHKALEDLKNVAINATDFYSDAVLYTQWKKQILAALPPCPQPTMAETQWDEDKHYLAEAKHDVHDQVIMLGLDAGGLIEFIIPSLRDYKRDADQPDTLTPTGNRYVLTEVEV